MSGRCCHCADTDIWGAQLLTTNDDSQLWPNATDWNGVNRSALPYVQSLDSTGRYQFTRQDTFGGDPVRLAAREQYGIRSTLILGHVGLRRSPVFNYANYVANNLEDMALQELYTNIGSSVYPLAGSPEFDDVIDHLKSGHDVYLYLPPIPQENFSQLTPLRSFPRIGTAYWITKQATWNHINQCLSDLGSATRIQSLEVNDWVNYRLVHMPHNCPIGLPFEWNQTNLMGTTDQEFRRAMIRYVEEFNLKGAWLNYWDTFTPEAIRRQMNLELNVFVGNGTAYGQTYGYGYGTTSGITIDHGYPAHILCNADSSTHWGYYRWARAFFDDHRVDGVIQTPTGFTNSMTDKQAVFDDIQQDFVQNNPSAEEFFYNPRKENTWLRTRTNHTFSYSSNGGGTAFDERDVDATDLRHSPVATIERLFAGRLIVMPSRDTRYNPYSSALGNGEVEFGADSQSVGAEIGKSLVSQRGGHGTSSHYPYGYGAEAYRTRPYQLLRTYYNEGSFRLDLNASQVTANFEIASLGDHVPGINQWHHLVDGGGDVSYPARSQMSQWSITTAADPSDGSVPDDIEMRWMEGYLWRFVDVGDVKITEYTVGNPFYQFEYRNLVSLPPLDPAFLIPEFAGNFANTKPAYKNIYQSAEEMQSASIQLSGVWQNSVMLNSTGSEYPVIDTGVLIADDPSAPAGLSPTLQTHGGRLSTKFSGDQTTADWLLDNVVTGTFEVELWQNNVAFTATESERRFEYQPNNVPLEGYSGSLDSYDRPGPTQTYLADIAAYRSAAGDSLDWSDNHDPIMIVVKTVVKGSDLEWGQKYWMLSTETIRDSRFPPRTYRFGDCSLSISYKQPVVNKAAFFGFDRNQDWIKNCTGANSNLLLLAATSSYGSFAVGQPVTLTVQATNASTEAITAISASSDETWSSEQTLTTLAAGTSDTFEVEFLLTNAHVNAGSVTVRLQIEGTHSGDVVTSGTVEIQVSQ